MPIKDLVASLKGIEIPAEVKRIAANLPYRDFITVGLLVEELKIKNKTKIKTYLDRVPDTWIYIQERDVRVGRLQVFNNWSPYMVSDYKNKMWIGLEYFCTEGDEMWNMPADEFIQMAIDELVKIDIVERQAVCESVQLKVKKAYPSYFGTYYELDKVIAFLSGIDNLYCIGRNGQHRYNNMDHSMLTAMTAVDCVVNKRADKSSIWEVNTEDEYHESKK
jgi:protoporphyrinogen oxidase